MVYYIWYRIYGNWYVVRHLFPELPKVLNEGRYLPGCLACEVDSRSEAKGTRALWAAR